MGLLILADLHASGGREGWHRAARDAVWVLSGATLVYWAGWILHFGLLTASGPGFAWAPRRDAQSSGNAPASDASNPMTGGMVDSCYMWRRDGALSQRMAAALPSRASRAEAADD